MVVSLDYCGTPLCLDQYFVPTVCLAERECIVTLSLYLSLAVENLYLMEIAPMGGGSNAEHMPSVVV